MMVRRAGFEPTTPDLEGRCSIQMSYQRGRILGTGNCENLPITCQSTSVKQQIIDFKRYFKCPRQESNLLKYEYKAIQRNLCL